ncbi:MAG: terminase family protein [Acidobacteriota bacterium]|nr:terminase family protein [Acidobacteriota bacterium]
MTKRKAAGTKGKAGLRGAADSAGETRIEVTQPAPKSPVQLLPYQLRWVKDDSTLKIVVKARQTGYSFSSTLRAVLRCMERRTTWVFLSKGERQSRMLMEKVQDHIQSCGIVTQTSESEFFEGTLMKQLEVRFPNGSVIYGLPANPDTARGYTGHVTLDEFAFHADAEKIYTALYPVTTRGYGLEVISTPNGQQNKFFDLAKAAGLADGERAKDNPWSAHKTSIHDAVAQGLGVNLPQLRRGVDDETWRQEFCCEFIAGASEWISAALLESCIDPEASADFSAWAAGSASPADGGTPALFAGWDIARNRDLSVIWLSQLVGDVTWTRGVIEMRNLPTPDQVKQARSLMPFIRRIDIDQSGMGLAIAEQLEREFPGKVEGVQFTQSAKESLAVGARRRMEERKVRIPGDERVRASFRSLKRTQNAIGQIRFDTEHDAAAGHADHWWAFALAEMACQRATGETAAAEPVYHLAEIGGIVGSPALAGFREAVL